MTDTPTTESIINESSNQPIVAIASREFRVKRLLLVVLLVGWGLWSDWDGFYNWPKQNEAARARGLDVLPHSGLDIPFNRALGIILPPAGLLLLAWSLRSSRGEYRLENSTLSVPGHPAIPLESIRSIDRARWDRKGIVFIKYESAGQSGRIKLDDFVYEREPTDQIFAELEKQFATKPSV